MRCYADYRFHNGNVRDENDREVNLEIRRAHSATGWNRLWGWLLAEPSYDSDARDGVGRCDLEQPEGAPEIDSEGIDEGEEA